MEMGGFGDTALQTSGGRGRIRYVGRTVVRSTKRDPSPFLGPQPESQSNSVPPLVCSEASLFQATPRADLEPVEPLAAPGVAPAACAARKRKMVVDSRSEMDGAAMRAALEVTGPRDITRRLGPAAGRRLRPVVADFAVRPAVALSGRLVQ